MTRLDTRALHQAPAAITLTTTGNRGVQLKITPAAREEAAGGITLSALLPDSPLALTLTEDEARQLVGQMLKVMV